jgi:hypothetical protein
VGHPAREITSGETGMMHAALTLFRHKDRNFKTPVRPESDLTLRR